MEPEEKWPQRVYPGHSREELRPHAIGVINFHDSGLDIARYSKWKKAVRVQCYVLRFISNLRSKERVLHLN